MGVPFPLNNMLKEQSFLFYHYDYAESVQKCASIRRIRGTH